MAKWQTSDASQLLTAPWLGNSQAHHDSTDICPTLLIPLVERAKAFAHGTGRWPDAYAQGYLDQLQPPCPLLSQDWASFVNVQWRTDVLMTWANTFFEAHPTAHGFNLGCGLSHPFQWLDNGRNHWVDFDRPEVVELRRASPTPRAVSVGLELCHMDWSEWFAQLPRDEPVVLITEGVLMYHDPDWVTQLLTDFGAHAPSGSVWLTDVISKWGVGMEKHHPSLRHTHAQLKWGLADLNELDQLHERLALQAYRSVDECYGPLGWWTQSLQALQHRAPSYSMVAMAVS